MKKIKIFILLNIIFISIASAQSYEELYNKAGFEDIMKELVDITIKKFSEKEPSISQSKWNEIKNSIDYSVYKTNVINLLKSNYTSTEVEEIFLQNESVEPLNETGDFLFNPSPSLKNELYTVSKEQGKRMMTHILESLGVEVP